MCLGLDSASACEIIIILEKYLFLVKEGEQSVSHSHQSSTNLFFSFAFFIQVSCFKDFYYFFHI